MLTLNKTLATIIPLMSYIAYNAAKKAPFSSLPCSLIHIGCLSSSDIPIHGFVDTEYKEAYDIFLSNFQQGRDIGASISAYVDGHQILSLHGGWQDVKKKIEYTNETLQMVFSSTKAFSAIVVAQLVDQGLLSYDERISYYWPEFAQGKKENVTIMDLMRHKAGLACLDIPLSFENASDPNILAEILAKQPHNFDGKSVHAYHALTQGWVQNEIIRRVDPLHRTVDGFAREFKKKWGIEWYLKPDVTDGLDLNRIAPFYEKSLYQQLLPIFTALVDPRKDGSFVIDFFDKNSLLYRSIRNANIDQQPGIMNRNPKYRSIEGPSYSGHTNADSMAKLAAMMANRGTAIVPDESDIFYKNETFDDTLTYIGTDSDAIFPSTPIINLRGGLLRFPNELFFKTVDNEADFIGGVGAGGSVFVFNEKYKIGFAYITNGYSGTGGPDTRSIPILRSIVERVIEKKKLESQNFFE